MPILEILLYSFTVVVGIQVIYYLILFGRFAFAKPITYDKKIIPTSVIICAKNEAKNLKRYLPSILNQEHPNFEVVLVNDGSIDDSLKIMNTFASNYSNIKIVDVKETNTFFNGKKQALTQGIKASSNDYLLFTDADCEAVSPKWIAQMTAQFNETKTILLGYGGYFKVNNSFINKVIRYETLLTAIQYFAYAKIGLPYMGVGRNLAYHKDEFFKTKGFAKHLNIQSGDDDLFINEAATSKNTGISFSKNSFTRSLPKKTFKDWIVQKRRHISTAKHYKLIHKLLLGLFYCSQFLFWMLATVLLAFKFSWEFVLILTVFRFAALYFTLNYSAKKLEETELVLLTPILELFLILTQFGIFIVNSFSKQSQWK